MLSPSARQADEPLKSVLTRVCRLAEGGMGRVDLAIHDVGAFRRMYAVKRLHPHLATDPEFRSMFLDEARIAGSLQHPNVVGVLDFGEDEEGAFLVMDYVDGLPLSNLVRLARANDELMPVQICLRVACDVARGLHAAHELIIDGQPVGLVHRDLSPQNVLLGFDGVARITDFGIAKALGRSTRTATGVMKGKLSYMSPEQLLSREPDRRSDLYSLGIVLFEMLAGCRLRDVRDSDPLDLTPPDIGEHRADVPDELVRLLFELLAESPDARPSDAREVLHALEAILAPLVAEQDIMDVAEYVGIIAAEARDKQRRLVQTALDDLGRSAANADLDMLLEETRLQRPARHRWVATAAIALVLVTAVAVWALQSRDAEPPDSVPVTAPALPPVEPEVAEATDTAAEEGDVEEESTMQSDPAARRRRNARRAKRRARMDMEQMQVDSWQSWDDG